MTLEKQLESASKEISVSAPEIFNLSEKSDYERIEKLQQQKKIQHVIDDYEGQLEELFQINNPSQVYLPTFKREFNEYLIEKKEKGIWRDGRWVYFPWISTLVHILNESEFRRIRTARNRNLITEEEQEKFYNATIGICGLSVGNSVATAIALQGGGKYMKLADFDRLSLSNTNRVRAGVENLGIRKVEVTARQIYMLNPYAKIEIFSEGINKENIEKFFTGSPKLDIVIDELDNLAIKYLIREQAKKHRIPVVMAADNGDNAVVDVERYDLNSKIPFFHGRMGKVSYESLSKLDKFGIGKMITKHIGPENVTERMQQSLLEMGKTIVSWPQLGGAALINGVAVAYCVRKILNGQSIEKNRALISLDEKLTPNYNSKISKKKRMGISRDFKKIFGL